MRINHLKRSGIITMLLAGLFTVDISLAEKPTQYGSGHDKNKSIKNKQYQRDEPRSDVRSDVRSDGRSDDRVSHQRDDYQGGNDIPSRRDDVSISLYFNDQHRGYVHDYYVQHYPSGRCPPGLHKRHNGCIPPGQVRKWKKGYPLPRDVIFYDLPPGVVIQLGAPPPHHRYVRVAADILLIAVGTGIVVDAISDLGR